MGGGDFEKSLMLPSTGERWGRGTLVKFPCCWMHQGGGYFPVDLAVKRLGPGQWDSGGKNNALLDGSTLQEAMSKESLLHPSPPLCWMYQRRGFSMMCPAVMRPVLAVKDTGNPFSHIPSATALARPSPFPLTHWPTSYNGSIRLRTTNQMV